jgi:glycosyltransferase involved in cell wall biosynthesis
MRQMFQDAEAVLVLNPITAALLEPFARRVSIVPWGIDPARFPWPADGEDSELQAGEHTPSVVASDVNSESNRESSEPQPGRNDIARDVNPGLTIDSAELLQSTEPQPGRHHKAQGVKPGRPDAGLETPPIVKLFMAAVAGEVIKGFHVAHEACRILREARSDFELVVTFDPAGPIDEFTRSVGWCSQDDLPGHYRAADICLVPTIAQDALSITSVEAMAAGKPVIASRIGGLPYTVSDGLTGLLFEPGNAFDLAEKIGRLLDDRQLRDSMGLAGRRRFEEDFMWPDVIKRYWRPLLPRRVSAR